MRLKNPLLIATVLSLFFASGLASCDNNETPHSHEYDNACDMACNICSEFRPTQHDYSTIEHDQTHHWYACSICDRPDGENKVRHFGGEATCITQAICNTCQTPYGELNPDNHIVGEYAQNVCECGEIIP